MGRPAGSPNKLTREIKETITRAFFELEGGGTEEDPAAGAVAYLKTVAKDEPKAFCGLLGKILPRDVNLGADQETVMHVIKAFDGSQ